MKGFYTLALLVFLIGIFSCSPFPRSVSWADKRDRYVPGDIDKYILLVELYENEEWENEVMYKKKFSPDSLSEKLLRKFQDSYNNRMRESFKHYKNSYEFISSKKLNSNIKFDNKYKYVLKAIEDTIPSRSAGPPSNEFGYLYNEFSYIYDINNQKEFLPLNYYRVKEPLRFFNKKEKWSFLD